MKVESILAVIFVIATIFLCGECFGELSNVSDLISKDKVLADNEVQIYDLIKDGQRIGISVFELKLVEDKEFQLYKITRKTVGLGTISIYEVNVKTVDLKPLSSRTTKQIDDQKTIINVDYREKEAHAMISSLAGFQKIVVSIPKETFDNNQLFMLFQRIPLKEGLDAEINIFTSSLVTIPGRVSVLKREKIVVPLGDFDCFKVKLSCSGQQDQFLWYAESIPHYLVMYDNGKVIYKLAQTF